MNKFLFNTGNFSNEISRWSLNIRRNNRRLSKKYSNWIESNHWISFHFFSINKISKFFPLIFSNNLCIIYLFFFIIRSNWNHKRINLIFLFIRLQKRFKAGALYRNKIRLFFFRVITRRTSHEIRYSKSNQRDSSFVSNPLFQKLSSTENIELSVKNIR